MAKPSESILKPNVPEALRPIELALAEAVAAGLAAIAADSVDKTQLPAAREIAGFLEQPPDSKMGDFALPCFRFAKSMRLKPNVIAEQLAAAIDGQGSKWVAKTQVIGAFLNFHLDARALANAVLPKVADNSFFTELKQSAANQKTKVMVEFSQPNTHKEFHVGHGRNICLGDAIVRMARYCGYNVIAANYPGDEGKHIAKVLWYIDKYQQQAPADNLGAWLGKMYSSADRVLKEDLDEAGAKAAEVEISAVLSAIESKQGPTYAEWQKTRQWSLDDFYKIYDFMDVHFDQYFFESEVSEASQEIVDEFLAKGIFKEDQGAIGVDLKEQKLGFGILRKSDGNTLYLTKDLVLARRKFDDFNIDHNIYVVADEQNLHFRQAFKILELMGFEQAKHCFHLSYGMVMLPEGKMSSRKGNSVTFTELITSVEAELSTILAKYTDEWSAEELAETAKRLCVGTIKYGMLNTDPVKTIIFDLKEWLSFEGNSGPYLMYSYARTQSILRKGTEAGAKPSYDNLSLLVEPEAKDLLRALYDFNRTVVGGVVAQKPSSLTHYLFDLSKQFNRFYSAVPVLKAPDAESVGARLALVESFSKVIHAGLNLLGMTPPEKM